MLLAIDQGIHSATLEGGGGVVLASSSNTRIECVRFVLESPYDLQLAATLLTQMDGGEKDDQSDLVISLHKYTYKYTSGVAYFTWADLVSKGVAKQ